MQPTPVLSPGLPLKLQFQHLAFACTWRHVPQAGGHGVIVQTIWVGLCSACHIQLCTLLQASKAPFLSCLISSTPIEGTSQGVENSVIGEKEKNQWH